MSIQEWCGIIPFFKRHWTRVGDLFHVRQAYISAGEQLYRWSCEGGQTNDLKKGKNMIYILAIYSVIANYWGPRTIKTPYQTLLQLPNSSNQNNGFGGVTSLFKK